MLESGIRWLGPESKHCVVLLALQPDLQVPASISKILQGFCCGRSLVICGAAPFHGMPLYSVVLAMPAPQKVACVTT